MNNLTISYLNYELDIEVTHFHHQKPLGVRADNPDDCYGYTEVEFEIKHLWVEDENGEMQEEMFWSSLLDPKDMDEIEEIVILNIFEKREEESVEYDLSMN